MRKLLDADIGKGGTVLLYRNGDRVEIEAGMSRFALPAEDRDRWIIRRVRPGLFLLVARRTDGEPNAALFTDAGERVRSFNVGDGVMDVLICGSRIVVTYFDEGVFGNDPLGREGIVVFNQRGDALWGYHSEIPRPVVIDDCYCACTDGKDRIWFTPYMEFPLVELDVERKTQRVWPLPTLLHGASALTTNGVTTFIAHHDPGLFDRVTDESLPPDTDEWLPLNTDPGTTLFAWPPGAAAPTLVGQARGRLRGLPHGRFISVQPRGFEFIAPKLDGS